MAAANAVKCLLDERASPDHQDSHGRSAIIWSSIYGHVKCIEALLERGARMADESEGGKIFAQFTSPAGEASGPQIEVPLNLTSKQLNGVINELLGKIEDVLK